MENRGRPISLITHMITDWIGLHSVLLPLLIVFFCHFFFTLFDIQQVFRTFVNADK